MIRKITDLDDEIASLWCYPGEGIIHHQFHQSLSGDPFRAILTAGLRLMAEHGATKWLSDDRKNTILPAEDSAWTQEYWLPRALKAGWTQWAMLPPEKARGRINIERLTQFVGEGNQVQVQLFADPDEAWAWLAQRDGVG